MILRSRLGRLLFRLLSRWYDWTQGADGSLPHDGQRVRVRVGFSNAGNGAGPPLVVLQLSVSGATWTTIMSPGQFHVHVTEGARMLAAQAVDYEHPGHYPDFDTRNIRIGVIELGEG